MIMYFSFLLIKACIQCTQVPETSLDFWNKSPNYFVLEFQKQVPETFTVYVSLNNLCEINNKEKTFKKVSNVGMLVIGMQSTETSCM